MVSDQPATQEGRFALILANAAEYAQAPLKKPVHDAHQIRAAAQKLNFRVTSLEEGTLPCMRRQLVDFVEHVTRSRQGSNRVVFIYYSGHSRQIDGEVFLIPVEVNKDAPDAELRARAMKLSELVGGAIALHEHAAVSAVVLIIDGCRDNAAGLEGPGTLKTSKIPPYVLLAFATGPGQTAEDDGQYAEALRRQLDGGLGRSVEEIIASAHASVKRADPRQRPEIAHALGCEQFLGPHPVRFPSEQEKKPCGPAEEPTPAMIAPDPGPAQPRPPPPLYRRLWLWTAVGAAAAGVAAGIAAGLLAPRGGGPPPGADVYSPKFPVGGP